MGRAEGARGRGRRVQSSFEPAGRLKLAVAQITARPGDVEANLTKHLTMIAAARAGGAQVLLFPELSLTGYGVGEQTPALAMPRGHAVLARLAEARRDIWTAAGFIRSEENKSETKSLMRISYT